MENKSDDLGYIRKRLPNRFKKILMLTLSHFYGRLLKEKEEKEK